MHIPFSKVVCDGHELAYVRAVLDSGWLTTASRTRELEEKFAAAVGARHACAVNSCTAALHLALEALGVGPGARVFVPTMTFTASAEIIRYLGADPVFLDVDYDTALVTPAILADAIARHPDVRTLVLVHFAGQACDLRPGQPGGILDLCARHGIRLVEDAAHAFPTRHHGRLVGAFGDATCFSFYANKTITTGEGGMLTTNDDAIARRARVMRLHGIDRDIWNRFTADKPTWEYDVVAPGFKYNMPDLNAAVGLAQLERAEEFRRERQRCADAYFAGLAGLSALDLPVCRDSHADHAWHLFPVVLTPAAPVERNRCIERLAERGIGTSVHYKPLHRMTYYRDRYGLTPADFPQAERIWQGRMTLPLYPSLKTDEIAYVIAHLRAILSGSSS